MKKYTHIFFDLDNTLWDFNQNSAATLLELYHEYSLDIEGISSPKPFIDKYKKINSEFWEKYRNNSISKEVLRVRRFTDTLRAFGIENEPLTNELAKAYLEKCPQKKLLIPDAHEVLSYLKEKYTLHILTNGFTDVQLSKIDNSDIAKYFNKIITSEDAGYNKPHAEIFEYAIGIISANASECLFVGDSWDIDILGAQVYGMDQMYYNPKKASHTDSSTYEIDSLLAMKYIL